MRGIPTILITVSPEVSGQMRPPRALYPKGFKVGNSLGRPNMRELQRQVLREYPDYGEQYEPPRVKSEK
jgi:D-proline reductase (dithiol) PrdB